jgi:putative membrane protein
MMFIFWILILAGLVFFVMFGVRAASHRTSEEPGETPLGILQKRYARGELTREQYEELKSHLGDQS